MDPSPRQHGHLRNRTARCPKLYDKHAVHVVECGVGPLAAASTAQAGPQAAIFFCGFESSENLCGMIQLVNDCCAERGLFDWVRTSTGTPTVNTGPTGDVTLVVAWLRMRAQSEGARRTNCLYLYFSIQFSPIFCSFPTQNTFQIACIFYVSAQSKRRHLIPF